ncbi:MAG: hypothetical protein HZA35_03245 [Parcubacteria group bacterium]|nr:hypothetical protein [Parcubacteria group bacterium]
MRPPVQKKLEQNNNRDKTLEFFSLSDLENYKKVIEESIKTAQHIMEGVNNDEETRAYYERHSLSEEEELAKIKKEILKRTI